MRRFTTLAAAARQRGAVLAVVSAALACGGGTSQGGERRPSPRSDVISADELSTVSANNALDAVRLLRPEWLRPRGSRASNIMPGVIVDNTPVGEVGDVSYLRTIPLTNIHEIRFLSASDATTRWGTGYVGGAIQVITRR